MLFLELDDARELDGGPSPSVDRRRARAEDRAGDVCGPRRGLPILDFDYLVVTPEGTRHFTERHEAMLFTDEQYRQAFERAGLAVEFDE